MATKKTQYHYIVIEFNYVKENGEYGTATLSILSKSEDKNQRTIPTMGTLVKDARNQTEKKGWKYIEGSLYITTLVKLTKEQFDALNDTTEP